MVRSGRRPRLEPWPRIPLRNAAVYADPTTCQGNFNDASKSPRVLLGLAPPLPSAHCRSGRRSARPPIRPRASSSSSRLAPADCRTRSRASSAVVAGADSGIGGVPRTRRAATVAVSVAALMSSPPDGTAFNRAGRLDLPINPHIYAKMAYNISDLTPTVMIAQAPLFPRRASEGAGEDHEGVHRLREGQPGKLNYGSSASAPRTICRWRRSSRRSACR